MPLIGLTSYRQRASWGSWDREAAIVQTSYVDCVSAASARPVVVPPLEPGPLRGSAEVVAAKLDGLVLVGGADVGPENYGDGRDPETVETHPWRDASELALVGAFVEARKPVLGVCRGAQVLNTYLGGTLHQHLPRLLGLAAHQPAPGEFGEMKVRAVPGSLVAAIVSDAVSTVMCSHHQAIDRLGRGLVVSARSDDGVVEAVEADPSGELAGQFVVGVQWHPEQSGDTRLFEAIVGACAAS